MKKYLLPIAFLSLAGCINATESSIDNLSKQTIEEMSCADFKGTLWDSVKRVVQETQKVPTAFEMSVSLKKQLQKFAETHPEISQDKINNLSLSLNELFKAILEEAPNGEKADTPEKVLMILAAIDVGDKSTVFREYMVEKTKKLFSQVNAHIQTMNLSCPKTPVKEAPMSYERHQLEALQAGLTMPVFGARWAFMTAYQSCQAVRLPAMTTQTPDVKGISIVGKHTDGVGSKRTISSLLDVQATHYYIKDQRTFSTDCYNVRKSPLIYDYGGKPYATTDLNSSLDLFKNNGDGTSALGIDCSGFVFSAMAAGGLKMQAGRPLKASDSWAWGSYSYLDPEKNGLTCLSKITVSPDRSLLAGDIVAIAGHVFMIDEVGRDPFGLDNINRMADCSKVSSNDFDFTIIQSSNSKNGIGINRYRGSDYLREVGDTIRSGMEKYAEYACQSRFNYKTIRPNVSGLSIVRHIGTPECLANRVKFEKEECVQECRTF